MPQSGGYHGPYLTWAGKTASPGSARQADAAPPVAEAASPAEFAAWPAPAPGAPRLHPTAAAYVAPPRVTASTPRPAAVATVAAPSHVYTPAPKPAAVAAYVAPRHAPAPKPTAAYAAPRGRAAHPAQLAVAAPAPAAAPAPPPAQELTQNGAAAPTAQAAGSSTASGVHYYSLHREYGLTPDQVETPKERPMVLIGPPDTPSSQKQDDADDAGGSDKHGGAQGADE